MPVIGFSKGEDIIDTCVVAINDRDSDVSTYSELCEIEVVNTFEAYYYEIMDEYAVAMNNGYIKWNYDYEFEKMEKHLGENFNVSYEILDRRSANEEEFAEIKRYLETEGHEPECEDLGSACSDLGDDMDYNKIPREKQRICAELFCETYMAERKVSEAYKMDVKFIVDGDKNIEFEDEIWIVKVNDKYVTVKYLPHEYIEAHWSYRHIKIDPEYIYDNIWKELYDL